MRRLHAILLSAAIAFGCTGCMTNPDQSSLAEPESSASDSIILIPSALPENFTITLPPGFTATSSAAYEEYYILNDASIIISDDPIAISGERLEHYTAQIKEVYEQTADDYRLQDESTVTINGTNAVILEFSYALIGENARQDLQAMVAVMLHHDVAYVITCKSKAETYLQYRGMFRSAIDSIEIETPPENTEGAVTHTAPATTTTSKSETAVS
ncbi:MAG: hypothetical protein IJC75_03910 [Oscillospiraceae bacterium]|nr:hypothetical protein [Oscillospiraceae bacterium]